MREISPEPVIWFRLGMDCLVKCNTSKTKGVTFHHHLESPEPSSITMDRCSLNLERLSGQSSPQIWSGIHTHFQMSQKNFVSLYHTKVSVSPCYTLHLQEPYKTKIKWSSTAIAASSLSWQSSKSVYAVLWVMKFMHPKISFLQMKRCQILVALLLYPYQVYWYVTYHSTTRLDLCLFLI